MISFSGQRSKGIAKAMDPIAPNPLLLDMFFLFDKLDSPNPLK
jgi:hypothetical protein